MLEIKTASNLAQEVHQFVCSGFTPHFDQLTETFRSDPTWERLGNLSSQLWLDTGSIADASEIWTRQFSALTTNNTLLNREVQTGRYDQLVIEAETMLAGYGHLTAQQRILEIAFILNARHGLKLVEKFDAYVSVEEHTDLAHDLAGTVEYARRYYAICPQRFIVKVPFTPAGLLATRKLAQQGVTVNHTLGFSARQNYVIARIGRPAYVNVFFGRLNSFVADNGLGDGTYVGEKATLASQAVIRRLRETHGVPSLQIGASFRKGQQVRDLVGIDVMTMPPKVARQFLELNIPPEQLTDRTGMDYHPPLEQGVDPQAIRLDTLWDTDNTLEACLDALEQENLDSFTPSDLVSFFAEHRCPDVLVRWTVQEAATSAQEGKIPKIDHWRDALASKLIGLDSLMNLAGLNSFIADQKAMDDRVAGVLASH